MSEKATNILPGKFAEVKADRGDILLGRQLINAGGYDAMAEAWMSTEYGCYFKNIIFVKEEIAPLDDEQIKDLLFPLINTREVTFSRGLRYVFVNYGFKRAD